ncbi:hypothetical protein QR680_000224 [Steinernema hermaphroditum]|uniref:Uncharacterized protein n=1 Tax=Steinernema hermaphroditum TaxID=289476 RepID=A0AA39GWM7_9BILA|nr:hypothetical protein QR680_000224 [Steinernema hermaphroditum]
METQKKNRQGQTANKPSSENDKKNFVQFVFGHLANGLNPPQLIVRGEPSKELEKLLKVFYDEFGTKRIFQNITMGYYGSAMKDYPSKQFQSGNVRLLMLTGSWPNGARNILKTYVSSTTKAGLTLPKDNKMKIDQDLIDFVVNNFARGRIDDLDFVAETLEESIENEIEDWTINAKVGRLGYLHIWHVAGPQIRHQMVSDGFGPTALKINLTNPLTT